MGYFRNIYYFLKRLLYRIPKKILIFIIIALLYFIMTAILPTSKVSAFSVQDGESIIDFGDIELYDNIFIYKYISSGVLREYEIWSFKSNDIFIMGTTASDGYYYLNYKGDFTRYNFDISRQEITYSTSGTAISNSNTGVIIEERIFYHNFDMKDIDGNVVFYSNAVVEPTKPYFVNWDEIESGNFENIVINTADYSIYDSKMYLSFKQYEPIVVSGETYFSPYKEKRLVLNNNEYCNLTRADGTFTIFSIPLSLFYALQENYKYDISLHVDGEELLFNSFICPALSDEERAQQEKDFQNATQQRIDNGVSNIDSFLKDDTTDKSTITDNMPSAPDMENPTEDGFNNIFETLRSAFTGQNYRDLEFEIPFTNGKKITIPSDLTENHVPTTIVVLIRMVYWFFISRFIVKDIAGYVDKAKSGDIFDSKESNIKTDML